MAEMSSVWYSPLDSNQHFPLIRQASYQLDERSINIFMKLHEIFTEAWEDKFFHLEQKIRSSNMTVGQFLDWMSNELSIKVNFTVREDAPSMRLLNASITSVSDMPSNQSQQFAGYKTIMDIEVGPGISSNTPVADIDNFMPVIRHELSHHQQDVSVPQDRLQSMKDEYVDMLGTSELSPVRALYTIQPLERSQRALDIAGYLARLGATPEAFEKGVKLVKERAVSMGEDFTIEDAQEAARSALFRVVLKIKSAEDFDKHEKAGNINTFMVLESIIGQLAMLSWMADQSDDKQFQRKARQQYHLLIKSIKKHFPKVKGYSKR